MAPAVGGFGTEADPWTLALDDDPSADVLLTAVRSAAGDEPLSLRLGLRAAPAPLDLGNLGMVLFSGSLYALCFSGLRWLGAITPFGGLAFLAGWLCLAWAAWKR